jgi:virginiamycin B lyase
VWFTETYNASAWTAFVAKSTTAGSITEYTLPTIQSGPFGITTAVGADGYLWFTETGNNKIGKIPTAGRVTEYPVSPANSSPE